MMASSSAKARSPASGVNSVIRVAMQVAGDLDFLPGGQLGVDGAELLVGLVGEPCDLVGDVDFAGRFHATQFLDFAFEFGHGFFKVQKLTHATGRLAHIGTEGS
jgi:hypothetical protein